MKEKITSKENSSKENSTLLEKIEEILKYTPAISLIIYICGFIVFRTHLSQFGIIETSIVNTRYIEAGILYLILAPFVLATNFTTNRKRGLIGSIFAAFFAFMIFNLLFCNLSWIAEGLGVLGVIALTSASYVFFYWEGADIKINRKDLTEGPLRFFMLFILSLVLFGLYFKQIRPNFGGGSIYHKVLILKDKRDNIIKTDSLNHSDTLDVIYENNEFIYIKYLKSSKSIRKELIEGEIYIREIPKKGEIGPFI